MFTGASEILPPESEIPVEIWTSSADPDHVPVALPHSLNLSAALAHSLTHSDFGNIF